jgi:hypothetical protein
VRPGLTKVENPLWGKEISKNADGSEA